MTVAYQINNLYTFNTHADTILGASFTNAKLVAIMDYYTAVREKNIDILQKQVFPFLPPGTPTDITGYTFYKFKLQDGTFVVMAFWWIDDSSVVLTTTANATFSIADISDTDVGVIKEQLRLLGYTPVITITRTS